VALSKYLRKIPSSCHVTPGLLLPPLLLLLLLLLCLHPN
jgi:hypothetical protein